MILRNIFCLSLPNFCRNGTVQLIDTKAVFLIVPATATIKNDFILHYIYILYNTYHIPQTQWTLSVLCL